MMDFKEFVNEVAEKIKDFLPDAFAGSEVSINEVTKSNDHKLTGITIRNDGSNISPNIYLDEFYKEYQDGKDMNTILDTIAKVRVRSEASHDFDVERIQDFDRVKDNIICKLVNRENNDEFLANRPYTVVEDLAVVYAVDLGENRMGHMSTAVTDSLMSVYGIEKSELHDIAMDNLSKADISFRSMKEVLSELIPGMDSADTPDMFPEGDIQMYVLTIKDRVDGAAAILDENTMSDIAERLGGDYVVIPSSTHEVIIVPMNETMTTEQLNSMVQEVNENEVSVEERLSDHVYMYDSEDKLLLTAEHYEEKHSVHDEEHDIVSEISSVKDKLRDKTAEVAKNEATREHPVKAKDAPAIS